MKAREQELSLEMFDVVRCPECGGWFGASGPIEAGVENIIQHSVREHPNSVIARAIATLEKSQ